MALILSGTDGITSSGGTNVLQDNAVIASNIANGAVTDAKIAAMAASKLTGQVPDANAPSGSVIQTVNDFRAVTRLATTSTSFVNTDITDTITPSSASSKILILISTSANTEAGGRNIFFNLARNGTGLAAGTEGMCAYLNVATVRAESPLHISHLDSPNTTSPVTYTLQVRSGGGSTIEVPHGTSIGSSIILMEIAA